MFKLEFLCIPLINKYNMMSIKNFLQADGNFEDKIFLDYLNKFAFGFVLTTLVITLIYQIIFQLNFFHYNTTFIFNQANCLESIKYYHHFLKKNKYCIFFQSCLAVIDTIHITIENYLKLNLREKREMFLKEVDLVVHSKLRSRIFNYPLRDNIIMYRKGIILKIQNSWNFNFLYKLKLVFFSSKFFFEHITPYDFLVFFERYVYINSNELIYKFFFEEKVNDLNYLLSEQIFFNYNLNEIRFNESIGINTVPLETFLLRTYYKHVVRSKTVFPRTKVKDFVFFSNPLISVLNFQKFKF